MSKVISRLTILASATLAFSVVLLAQAPGAEIAPAYGRSTDLRNPLANDSAAIESGRLNFELICTECHIAQGKAKGSLLALNTGFFMHGADDSDVFRTIRNGVKGTDMEAHDDLTEKETWQLVSYIKSLSGGSHDLTFIQRYCLGCHNDEKKSGDVSLQHVTFADFATNGSVLEKVLKKVSHSEMPPTQAHALVDPSLRAEFLSSLEAALDHEAAVRPNPGWTPAHRLNRAEYSNAVRDLLALDVKPGEWLPVDDSGYGFDNIAAVLTASPVLLDRYMVAARRLSRWAVGDLSVPPGETLYDLPSDPGSLRAYLPFVKKDGVAIEHYFPVDAEYEIELYFSTEPEPGAKTYVTRTFVPAGMRVIGAAAPWDGLKAEPQSAGGRGGFGQRQARGPAPTVDLFIDKKPVHPFEVHEEETRVRRIAIRGPSNIRGRGDTPSRARIFTCRPATAIEEQPCARKILSTLARRAFRRSVTDADIKPLLAFFRTGRAGGDFDHGIEMALRAMLVSPEFLFRVEPDPVDRKAGQNYSVSDVVLASRLSFFLWSSIPDDELLDLAEQGRLREPAVLRQQIARMLRNPKSQALVDNFAGQWLQTRRADQVTPDANIFSFDESLRSAFMEETRLFVASIVREDRSVLDLLDADYTYLNERLAKHYGIPNVYGQQFRRVSITDPNRRGILGQGSVLMVTSYPNRTSVVQRGKWVLESLLGSGPPPPPPDVPDLKPVAADGRKFTMREAMEDHRQNPVCSSCHSRMDPLGFALENFDGVGRWRDTDSGQAIDASGRLPDGTQFEGPAGLRQLLLTTYKEDFMHTAAENLLMYALGRGLEYYDYPTVREVARQAAKDDYRFSSLITAIAQSTAFQMRRIKEP
ncbi:MAG: DUF1592 domain-containing protein [Steroidobacteraceae bacterium]